MSNLVYVINKNGNPLMPCKPAKARHLLEAGKAKVIKRIPFTIQLLWNCEENVQPITLGIDKGSKITGLCVVESDNSKVLFQADLRHRLDVKEKMETRREHRRSRRNRKWYRPCRFLNRSSSKRIGRLPPSIRTNVEEVIRVVNKLKVMLPITSIVVEDVLVDIRKLNEPIIKGKQYQVSNRLSENLRLACLMRDNFVCYTCKSKGELHAHHIVWRSKGGSDTITNLITLCKKCHNKVHSNKLTLDLRGSNNFKDRIAQRTMQGKSYLYRQLGNPGLVYGYETAEQRKKLQLDKTHMIDAFIIAGGNKYTTDNSYFINFRLRQTRRQYYDLPRKGVGRVRYQVNEELNGFKKGDVVLVKSFVKQINSIRSDGRLGFSKSINSGPQTALPKHCILLERQKTVVFNTVNIR